MPVGGAYDQRPEAGDETGPVQQGTCNSLGKKDGTGVHVLGPHIQVVFHDQAVNI